MSNKRLKIENLENLQELNGEEVFSIQGGLSLEAKVQVDSVETDQLITDKLIYVDPEKPVYEPYPLPPYPYPCYPTKPHIKPSDDGSIIAYPCYCYVIL
ncbi:MAG: hypothetical protein QNJ63_31185 [Calothrix sp. MO_192.B10]|nr:hypothetical protein [Calothrix sp. MO_192.B10]